MYRIELSNHYLQTDKFYIVNGKTICIFTKVTPKGYNFLNVKNSEKKFKQHLYPKSDGDEKYYFTLPASVSIVILDDDIKTYLSNKGESVVKGSISRGKPNNKKFKSGYYVNTVKDIIIHPILNIPAYRFWEDNSYVECRRCIAVNQHEYEQQRLIELFKNNPDSLIITASQEI